MINTNELRKMAQIPEVNKAVTWAQVLGLAASVTELANGLDANELLIGQLKMANRELTAEVVKLREMTRWIPVSEKLPSDPQRVIYCDPYDVGFANFYKGYFWPDDANGCMDMTVTHWKPFEFPSRPEVGE